MEFAAILTARIAGRDALASRLTAEQAKGKVMARQLRELEAAKPPPAAMANPQPPGEPMHVRASVWWSMCDRSVATLLPQAAPMERYTPNCSRSSANYRRWTPRKARSKNTPLL
jgi:hypothetical protein